MPSSTAARVACIASSTRSLRSLTSTSVAPPTRITATPPAKALVIGRFVPIVRTFITLVAGVGRMNRRHFFLWSFVGAVLWATGLTLLGYFLGGIDFLQHNIEAAILLIVFVSVLPMVIEWWRHRRAIAAVVEDLDD